MPKGGKREGAGRPKGVTNQLLLKCQETLDREGAFQFLMDAWQTGEIDGERLTAKERTDIVFKLFNQFMPTVKSIEFKVNQMSEVEVVDLAGVAGKVQTVSKQDKQGNVLTEHLSKAEADFFEEIISMN